jgi:hypothetical protein
MYHHANTDINLQPSDHASISTKSSETRRREIPLAFTNTWWGREYVANPNWEKENLGKSNAAVCKGSRGQEEVDDKTIQPSHSASTAISANTYQESGSSSTSASTSAPSTTSPPPPQPSRQYSVMTAWTYFRHTFPPQSSLTSDSPDPEKITPNHTEREESVELGPWLEILMRWDDFEQWELKMLQRSWCLPDEPYFII